MTEKCAVEPSGGVPAECGQLVTWENRKTKKRLVRLPFIRLKTSAKNPKPDPVVYTSGGPGVSSLSRVRGAQYLRAYMAERDFIVFEQRGTSYAEPSLDCQEVSAIYEQGGFEKKNLLSAVRECHRRLIAKGIDLNSYNTGSIADDFEELRKGLGIDKWNLFGASYSTQIMLTIAREYPRSVRSIVLDSPLPLSVNYDETSVDAVVNSLNRLFDRCNTEKECREKYPSLRRTFYSAVRQLNDKPFTLPDSKDTFDGSDLVGTFYSLLNYPDGISKIPGYISLAKKRDKEFLTKMLKSNRGSDFIWGMRYSVWCSDEMPFQDASRIAKNRRKYSKIQGFGIQKDFVDICRVWNVDASPPVSNEPVVSDLPTLILSGRFDPNTPPEWGRLIHENFNNSFFFEFPEMGHLINFNSGCGIGMIGEFLKKPESKPDSSCIKTEKRIKFN